MRDPFQPRSEYETTTVVNAASPHPLPASLIDTKAMKAWFDELGKPLLVLAAADVVSLVAKSRGPRQGLVQARRWVTGEVTEDACLEFAKGLPRRVWVAVAVRRVLWSAAAKTTAASEATSAVRDVLAKSLGTTDLENEWLKINEEPDPDDDADMEGVVTPAALRDAEEPLRAVLEPYTKLPVSALEVSRSGATDPAARRVLLDLLLDAGWPPLDVE